MRWVGIYEGEFGSAAFHIHCLKDGPDEEPEEVQQAPEQPVKPLSRWWRRLTIAALIYVVFELGLLIFGADVVLTWQDNSDNEMMFTIDRSSNLREWSTIGSVERDVTTYTDVDVPAGIWYYRVWAVNNHGYRPSETVKAVIKEPIPDPVVEVKTQVNR